MKQIIIGISIVATFLMACTGSTDKSNETVKKDNDTTVIKPEAKAEKTTQSTVIKDVVTNYLQIKNALTNDDGKAAATAGNATVEAIGKVDISRLTPDQKKTYGEMADDIKEMSEHIGKNADKLEHQREHFDMLSKDVYDLVKQFGAGQSLYKDFCPMYNNKKGAIWLSETKEIHNPYLGKSMPTCGSIKEELK